MNRSIIIRSAALAGLLALASAPSVAPQFFSDPAVVPRAIHEPYARQKVVYHITQGGGWFGRDHAARLQSMLNHVNAVGRDKLDMVAILQGDGASLLYDAASNSKLSGMVDRLRRAGIRFVICRNTLVGRNYPVEDLYGATASDLVPAGVAEVVDLQQKGYVLVRL
ncbi:hypothetical protein GCM10007036_45920 [Alsobacter metallidurans]|uniref:DsrE/DsrF-like family protein n=1 Tax=Alsobacter metallidurans TaxID=340221 RepID=A0A917IAL8_9HYPH|nr:DsrE family protein [Alsobacter metallidurans]GGH33358.1 hypothetical protein GCM10007036_45920 [Alsobacter metallidurans]